MLSTCVKMKDLCRNGKLKTTPHISIMEELRNRAEKFRKQGRLQDKELEEIINEFKEVETNNSNNKWEGSPANDKHKREAKAIKEGLLQTHGTPPNTKQDGIFRIMGENCNGLNSRIGGNGKIRKILAIKEDLDIDCIMLCEHWLNFKQKENKNDLKQMFQCKIACTAVSAHNVHEA